MGKRNLLYIVETEGGAYYVSNSRNYAICEAEDASEVVAHIIEVDLTDKEAFPKEKVYPTIKIGS